MVMWKVMAGRGSAHVREFVQHNIVAIGWAAAGDHALARSRADLLTRFAQVWPNDAPRKNQVGAFQVWRFLKELAKGDCVVVYDPGTRIYHVGELQGSPQYQPDLIEALPTTRSVVWLGTVGRDSLSLATRNALGGIMTFYRLSDSAAFEIASALAGGTAPPSLDDHALTDQAALDEVDGGVTDPFANIADQALELVKDRVLALEWDQMQELVAALLRALGYRTMISLAGADRGRDIIASKDGFGFEPPRILVEVKHRKGSIGAPDVRAFLAGLHSEDRGLYVSTGGFTREAEYEAARAATVTHLMSLDGLARALIAQYENLDDRGRTLLPLTKIYWPA
jgi:restriction system protein